MQQYHDKDSMMKTGDGKFLQSTPWYGPTTPGSSAEGPMEVGLQVRQHTWIPTE